MSKLKVELNSIDLVDLLIEVEEWIKNDNQFLPLNYAALLKLWLLQKGATKMEEGRN